MNFEKLYSESRKLYSESGFGAEGAEFFETFSFFKKLYSESKKLYSDSWVRIRKISESYIVNRKSYRVNF